MCLDEVRPLQVRPVKPRLLQVQLGQARVRQRRLLHLRPVELRPAEDGPLQVRPAEVGPLKVCLNEVRSFQVRPAEVRPLQMHLAEPRFLQARREEDRFLQVHVFPAKAGKIDPMQVQTEVDRILLPTTASDHGSDRPVVGRNRIVTPAISGSCGRVLAQVGGQHLHDRPVQLGRVAGDLLQRVHGSQTHVKLLMPNCSIALLNRSVTWARHSIRCVAARLTAPTAAPASTASPPSMVTRVLRRSVCALTRSAGVGPRVSGRSHEGSTTAAQRTAPTNRRPATISHSTRSCGRASQRSTRKIPTTK